MKLWFRLIFYILTLCWRPRLSPPDDASELAFRVWPTDLDTSLHMNNGRYLTIMDLGRLDLMVRSGLWRAVLRHRWTPIANAVHIRFRRELGPFQKFTLQSALHSWSAAIVVMEQRFIFASGTRRGEIAASALFLGGLYDRQGKSFVPIERLMSELGIKAESPEPSAEVKAFLEANEELRKADCVRTGAARPLSPPAGRGPG
ncbi:MAG: thioesterase [Hyphomicrobiaceae bacterium]|nr:MAG: thioesterase [Hyphomicrobiaceae bacterium]